MVTRDSEQYLRFKREHTLPSHEAIMDWYRGTGMRPYLQALDDAGRKKFEAEVFSQVREEYPTQSDGSIIFPFPRFFFLATREKLAGFVYWAARPVSCAASCGLTSLLGLR